jgi:hypothetical protein
MVGKISGHKSSGFGVGTKYRIYIINFFDTLGVLQVKLVVKCTRKTNTNLTILYKGGNLDFSTSF